MMRHKNRMEDNESLGSEINKEIIKQRATVLKQKSILSVLLVFTLLLIIAGAAYAWYTRISDANILNVDIAGYNLTTNQVASGEYLLDMLTYSQVTNQKFAPGVVGYIPLDIGANLSDVDTGYNIKFISKMPEDIQKRVRLFYLRNKSGNKIYYGDAVANLNSFNRYNKVYMDFENPDEDGTNAETQYITDVIPKGESKKLVIYFEWLYDAESALAEQSPLVVADKEKLDNEETCLAYRGKEVSTWEEYCTSWDEYDTDIGRFPDKYKDAFRFIINASGDSVNVQG